MAHISEQGRTGASTTHEFGEKAKEAAETLKAGAEERADEMGARAREMAEELRSGAEEKAGELGANAADKLEEAGRVAGRAVTEGASRAGERLESVVAALRAASDKLGEYGEGWLADYAREAATRVDHMSGYLADKDAGGMVSDLEEKARSNPSAFLGGTLATGLVLGRFLRSSARRSGVEGEPEGERVPAMATAHQGDAGASFAP